MGKRRSAREAFFKILCDADVSKADITKVALNYWRHLAVVDAEVGEETNSEIEDFANRGAEGVQRNVGEIDRIIELNSTNWRVDRMTIVDRNVLRMAVYELLYCADIPANVTINEAIDIGKKFGTEDSGAFINGILDNIAKELNKK